MKIRFAVILGLLISVSCQVSASDYNYTVYYHVGDYGPKTTFWSQTTPITDWSPYAYPGTPQAEINIAQYSQNGENAWNGDTGFYVADIRSPLLEGQTAVFYFYVWARATASPQDMLFSPSLAQSRLSPGLGYALRLMQVPNGITYTGATTWGLQHGNITLPFYATDDPLTGYKFEATITAPPPVPEPSSILTLSGGLAALVGFALRRRRR